MGTACPVSSIVISGNELRFEQLLDKVIDNAIDYTPIGGRISIRLLDQVFSADLRIANQGPPISLPHDVKPFQLFAGTRNNASGHHLGLGLYVVGQIAQTLGARPTIENTEDGVVVSLIEMPQLQLTD